MQQQLEESDDEESDEEESGDIWRGVLTNAGLHEFEPAIESLGVTSCAHLLIEVCCFFASYLSREPMNVRSQLRSERTTSLP